MFLLALLLSFSWGSLAQLECYFCEAAAEYLLIDPQGVNNIDYLLEKVCSLLPNSTQPSCFKGVKSLEVFLNNIPLFLARKEQFTAYALCTMVNECAIDCCTSDGPEQVHLSYLDDPHSQVGVTWVTRRQVSTVVMYGTSPDALLNTATGTTKTYTPGYWHGWLHYVSLKGLNPGTTYYYKAGSDDSGWSQVFQFVTEDLTSNTRTIRIANIGDMGLQNSAGNIQALKTLVKNKEIDFILHNGDISYADGFQQRWDTYFREMEDAIANIPYMVTLGNHEIAIFPLLNLTVGYPYRFLLPGAHSLSLDYSNLFYSFNYGNVHFIALDTESTLDIASMTPEQVQWVRQDLSSVDRQKYPWVLVFGHRPLYCVNSDRDCDTMALELRNALEDIFYEFKVDIVFGAHKHNYQRMWPTYRGKTVYSYVNPGLPVHILNGAGGNREGVESNIQNPVPIYNARLILSWGYGILTVYNASTLDYDFYSADNGALLDHVTLSKSI